jgi:bifunctional DNA-binding transcriptional regulator/antitoxin component of YhaV-PrlF toxin-antitoxin module
LEFRGKEQFEKSKIFDGGKTYVPVTVRRDLKVDDGDNLIWVKKTDGYLVRSTLEPIRLIHETLSKGGITCPKCRRNYEANLEKCPNCGAPNPTLKPNR